MKPKLLMFWGNNSFAAKIQYPFTIKGEKILRQLKQFDKSIHQKLQNKHAY